MEIVQVISDRELKEFIHLPYSFYQHDPVWVPPLRSEVRAQFTPSQNPFLTHCEYSLFLLKNENRVIGRIAAFIDTLAVDFWKEAIGLFGYYECIDNLEASSLLLDTAADWLRGKGMAAMRGPWSFVSQEWGLVVEGFTPDPVIMAPYNPPYYSVQMQSFGLNKVKDLLCYYISGREGYQIPERILNLTDSVSRRFGVSIRPLDMSRYDDEVNIFLDLSNRSIIYNWGYSPVTDAEADAIARDLKQILQPRGVIFAVDGDEKPIGFAVALPDVNVLLKDMNGRLLPLGWLKLLRGLPGLTNYRMFALGVIPEYHGKGIDSLLYRALYESLFTPDLWMEINYVLEDNVPMNNAIRKLGAKPLRRYRIFEQTI